MTNPQELPSYRRNMALLVDGDNAQPSLIAEVLAETTKPRLTRQGYSPKVLADQFHTKPSEIRRFLSGQLDAGRTRELADRIRAVGLAL